MPKFLSTILIAGALSLPATTSFAHHDGHAKASDPGVLHVSATASADAVPDKVSVMAGVQTEGKTAQEAMIRNSELMRNVFSTLTALGVPERDISTSYLNLNPRYNYENRQNGQPQLIGYQASNQITVTSQDLTASGAMIDALIKAGINNINNVQFTVSDPDMAQSEARTKAIAKAQMKARTMAQAANVRLGRLLSLSEGGSPGPIYRAIRMGAQMESMDATPPLAPGQREISATVSMTYELLD